MFKIYDPTLDWGGRPLTLETGRVARQADGSVLARYGETTVLCTAVWSKTPSDAPFFPLRVDYQEKFFAVGRIPGSFFKREGRPSESEVLNARLIDRPIRPMFPDGFRHDVHVVATVLVYDLENDPGITALIGASAALALSGVPFAGPVGGARVGRVDNQFVLNPKATDLGAGSTNKLDLLVAGTNEGVLMVESEAHELDESTMLEAVMFGHQQAIPVIDLIGDLAQQAGRTQVAFTAPPKPELDSTGQASLKEATAAITKAYALTDKRERVDRLNETRAHALEQVDPAQQSPLAAQLDEFAHRHVREMVLSTRTRIDGRKVDEIRPIESSHGVLPRVHGSALFTRGETQSLAVVTLGTGQDEQIVDSIEGESRQSFLLHYNFPPYSVGEGGGMRPPGRREIGHGKLAWRALHPLMPNKEAFPYTVRVVSEITESNGSSSMATVCSSTIALLDAGVPLERPCAGIAMGLIKDGDQVAVLSDILGDEDHLGDMDFKVAGTKQGITSLQMDIKITSITEDIMRTALQQAKDGRLHILEEMSQAITPAGRGVSKNAPRVITLTVPQDKIRDIIGPGGRIIREITTTTGTRIDIDDDGVVQVSSLDQEGLDQAIAWIERLTAKPEVNRIYQGTVVRIVEFGAFVNILEGQDGLLHISEIAERRINRVEDVLQVGQVLDVKCIDIDERGRVRLSVRRLHEDVSESDRDRGGRDRGDRGGDRDRGDRGDRGGPGRGRGGPRRPGHRGGSDDR